MNAKILFPALALILFSTTGWAAFPSYPTARPAPGEDLTSVLRQLKTGLADLKHETQNHENEIRVFENKLQNQESAFEQLRQQLTDDLHSQREFSTASNINLEGKTETLDHAIQNLDSLIKGLTADLRQIKTQANDSVAVLGQYKQKMSELENLLQAQSQHMRNLESALQSMMEVWQAKEATKEIGNRANESLKSYKVQPGDSLEKIARAQKVSVQSLRDANHLTNDRIIVGQTLKIP